MLKLLFSLRTFTEFYSHIHAFILTKQTIINTDCGEGMHFSALVTRATRRREARVKASSCLCVCVCVCVFALNSTFELTLLSCEVLESLIINTGS